MRQRYRHVAYRRSRYSYASLDCLRCLFSPLPSAFITLRSTYKITCVCFTATLDLTFDECICTPGTLFAILRYKVRRHRSPFLDRLMTAVHCLGTIFILTFSSYVRRTRFHLLQVISFRYSLRHTVFHFLPRRSNSAGLTSSGTLRCIFDVSYLFVSLPPFELRTLFLAYTDKFLNAHWACFPHTSFLDAMHLVLHLLPITIQARFSRDLSLRWALPHTRSTGFQHSRRTLCTAVRTTCALRYRLRLSHFISALVFCL